MQPALLSFLGGIFINLLVYMQPKGMTDRRTRKQLQVQQM